MGDQQARTTMRTRTSKEFWNPICSPTSIRTKWNLPNHRHRPMPTPLHSAGSDDDSTFLFLFSVFLLFLFSVLSMHGDVICTTLFLPSMTLILNLFFFLLLFEDETMQHQFRPFLQKKKIVGPWKSKQPENFEREREKGCACVTDLIMDIPFVVVLGRAMRIW